MTILGTLAGSAAVSLHPDAPFRNRLGSAIGSGFGYYSLSSIFITEYKGAELGTIALLANISREIITDTAGSASAGAVVRNLAPIFGRRRHDDGTTTLPIITRTAGQQFVVVSHFPRLCGGLQCPVSGSPCSAPYRGFGHGCGQASATVLSDTCL